MNVLIAAGGTGGHITPGIAIANKLKEDGNKILFVGTTNGMEVDLVPKAGYDIKYIHAKGLHRGLSLKNIKSITELIKGINEVKKIISEENIDLVVGTGGYVTAPAMIAALKCKVPTLIHESNALPGKTTSWLSGKVDVVAVGFEAALKKLPKAKNAVYTGNPTKLVNNLNKDNAKQKLQTNKPIVLVFGGSQGAKKLNDTMIELINNVEIEDYHMIYATGPKHYDEIIGKIDKDNVNIKNQNVKIEKYIYNMEEIMVASDLAVCRSGALTVTELGIVGLPAILIPFPYAAENHQYYNAKTIEDSKAGIIIEEKDLTSELLKSKIKEILESKERLQEMQKNAKKEEMKNAMDKIMIEINKITKERKV
ncbi:MAG: undecaprenyldiphospho-muramoylpentapeptide beta-N-acetylglucosaminyltransferase [Clostridia bacterium]|nr:undecaprenyldiphospho-muramoylpentapeptide beta-N-acetylglucosaminyltransferase [Clostridia bacterium]